MAFLNKHGQKGWQIVWNDRTKGRGKKGRRTASCPKGNHDEAIKIGRLSSGQRAALANGATNRDQRAALLNCYKLLELSKAREAVTAGGYGRGARYTTSFVTLVEKYLKVREALGELRESAGERKGKSLKTVEIDRAAIKKLKKWLKETGNLEIEAGELNKSLFEGFRLWLMGLPHERAKNRTISTVSVNKHLRSIRGCINYLADDQGNRPYFRVETKALLKGLRTEKEEQKVPACYKPEELGAFLKELIRHDAGGKVKVEDKKNDREYFMKSRTTTDLVPWFLLLALTGCRLSDAEKLKWSAIDFDSGSITWIANKTYRERRLMLNDSKNTVCPILLEILREWRKQRPGDVYVLKGNSKKKTPVFPKLPWEGVRAVLDLDITPKKLRSNWVSFMASSGRDIAVIPLWAGHSMKVCQAHYMNFASDRFEGSCLAEIMGLKADLECLLSRLQSGGTGPSVDPDNQSSTEPALGQGRISYRSAKLLRRAKHRNQPPE